MSALRLSPAMRNLLRNAFKYAKTRVRVSAEVQDGQVQ